MIQILSRAPGEMTMFETDDPAAAVEWVWSLGPDAQLLSITFTDGGDG